MASTYDVFLLIINHMFESAK